jgi:Domain of unknown function (DUF5615)
LRPKFLADENLSQAIVDGILRREPAIDILTASDGEILGMSDPDVLRIAAENGRIVLSHDRRTMPAHFDRFIGLRTSPGLLVLSQELDIGDAIEQLLMIWVASDAGEWENQRRFLPL